MSRLGLGLGLSKGRAFSPFDPLSLNPILAYEASRSMLAAGGGAAGNLDLVPTFENQVSGGANATQTTATYQPRAHVPVGDGHLYLSGVSGNYASLAAGVNLGTQTEILIGVKVRTWSPSAPQALIDQYPASFMVWLRSNRKIQLYYDTSQNYTTASAMPADAPLETVIKIVRDGTDASTEVFYKDHDGSFASLGSTTLGAVGAAPSGSGQELSIGRWRAGNAMYADCSFQTLKVTADSTVTLDLDMSDGAHKASSFTCASGQTVTINKSGNDPATIVRRSFLRFDGVDNFMTGAFNESNTTGGYMFAVFSVNGDGGESSSRVFSMNSSNIFEKDFNNIRSFIFSLRYSGTNDLAFYYNSAWRGIHADAWDSSNGVILHEIKAVDGNQISKINNADPKTNAQDLSALSSEQFNLGHDALGAANPAIDLEALYLFDHTLTDGDANKIRDYLNAKSSIY